MGKIKYSEKNGKETKRRRRVADSFIEISSNIKNLVLDNFTERLSKVFSEVCCNDDVIIVPKSQITKHNQALTIN
jgi:hypothetical protein